ncbi:MAG TPA: anti-sigma factor [Solirubrobacteraceae bacterium]|nr:anti-sigma factor [Solirubrobacteraceae bacterium]
MNAPTPADGCGSDVAAYALGALSEEETRRFEAHLRTCELCRADLAGLRPVVEALPAAAEAMQPPPALRKRIMRVVEAEARERRAAAAAAPRRDRLGFLRLRPLPALAAACALLLGGVGIGLVALQDDAETVRGEFIRAGGEVELRVDDGHGTLKIEDMDQPPRGRVYQVWTLRNGEEPKATDALFTVDKDGSASVDVPGELEDVDQVLVTDEPPGGSHAPTTAPYLAVRMS